MGSTAAPPRISELATAPNAHPCTLRMGSDRPRDARAAGGDATPGNSAWTFAGSWHTSGAASNPERGVNSTPNLAIAALALH
jgi:hypothetical protein